jgi:hypothetical protein
MVKNRVVVKIADFVGNDGGDHCYDICEAAAILTKILSILYSDNKVTISFDGVGDLATSFLNICIGQLYYYFEEEKVSSSVKIEDIKQDDLERIKNVVDNAKKFYAKK